MRLINTTTNQLEEFFDTDVRETDDILGTELPEKDAILFSKARKKYAILSHCWSGSEVSYQDFQKLHHEDVRMKKIAACCSLAKHDGYEYVWIDTCCINKDSSAELSEAINSMFSYYENSDVCYVFLSDINTTGKTSNIPAMEQLLKCRWFERGWTLQELIAPKDVRFYDADGILFGTKHSLADVIASKTKIPVDYLLRKAEFQDASISQRMSWASGRSTTRQEDVAYSLLGIFGVNIPLLYGEGSKAFRRLQHAIIAQSDDETIFAWLSDKSGEQRGMLAKSPAEFATTGRIKPIHYESKRSPATVSSRGIEIEHAYVHPIARAQEKLCEALIGRSFVSASKVIKLRLDCELTDEHGVDSWIGVSLQQSASTGYWRRINAGQLYHMRQNARVKKVYPAFVGWKTIYVTEPTSRDLGNKSSAQRARDVSSRYSRPVWISLLWQATDILSSTSTWWFVCAFHVLFGLPFANMTLHWTYLTGYWQIQGGHLAMFIDNLILGMFGWGADRATYDAHNLLTAILAFLPMLALQLYFDMRPWKVLEHRDSDTTSESQCCNNSGGEKVDSVASISLRKSKDPHSA